VRSCADRRKLQTTPSSTLRATTTSAWRRRADWNAETMMELPGARPLLIPGTPNRLLGLLGARRQRRMDGGRTAEQRAVSVVTAPF
jgi:hypothetical protein